MSPLYIKMRPEDNVTVDMRDLTATESLIILDIASGASHSGADSSASPSDYVVRCINVPEHDNDGDMQAVCVSHKPSSSNELHDLSDADGDSNKMCNPETSVKTIKTHSIADTSENVVKYSETCDTSQIVSTQLNSECADLNLSVPQNITACSIQSPDSSTADNWRTKLPDKPQKLVLNKVKLREVKKPKAKSKFNIHNFVKSVLPKKKTTAQEISEHSNITEHTLSNVNSEKVTSNFTNTDTKSRRKGRKERYSSVKDASAIESIPKLPNKEQSILEDRKERKKKKRSKAILKAKMNLDKNEDAVSEESRTEHVVDTEEKSLLQNVEYPEDTHKSHSRGKSTSKLKHRKKSVENDEPIEPAVPVNVTKSVDKKSNKKKKKSCREENQGTEKNTETKLKSKKKIRKHVLTCKASRKYVLEDTSDEEKSSIFENIESKLPNCQSSTTEVSSKLDENETFYQKNNDVPKKTDKEDMMQKDCDNNHGNRTGKKGKTKLKKKIKLDENRQSTVPTEDLVVQSGSKLADKKRSSELENLEHKMPTVSVSPIDTEKLERIPELSENCRTGLENREQPAPRKELEIEENPQKMVEPQNTALKNVKLSDYWNVYPISPILVATESLSQRWANTGLIAPLNKNYELRRRASDLPRINNDELQLQETSKTVLFDNQNSTGKAFVNPLANASEPLKEFSLDANKQYESYLTASGISKLPDKEVPSTNMKSHETYKPNCQISFDTSKETTTAKEPFVDKGQIMSNTETAMNNAMLSGVADFPTPFFVPSAPPRNRIRINTNTNIERQTLPSKNNTEYDSSDDDMEEEQRNTSEESSARNKHSFNFVNMTVKPPKRTQQVKITRLDMSEIETRNVKRKPLEFDSISIYADSLRNDSVLEKNDFNSDDKDKEITPIDTNDIISDWFRDNSDHATDNVTRQNIINKQVEEGFPPFKYPRINYNMFVEDEALPPINNSVVENTTKRPCVPVTPSTETLPANFGSSPATRSYNQDTLFDGICKNVMKHGSCRKPKCDYQHTLARDWEITLQNMPQEYLRNHYNNMKKGMNLYMFKKLFLIVLKQLVFQRDFNGIISLVKDVLEINFDSERTPYINAIIDALRSMDMTFNSVIDIIFNSTFVARNLKEHLTDILIYICMANGDIENIWSSLHLLMNYHNYHVDVGIIETILKKCLTRSRTQKEFCLKVYHDLMSHISNDTLRSMCESLLNDYMKSMRTLRLSYEARTLYERIYGHPPTGFVRSKVSSKAISLFEVKGSPTWSSPPTSTQIATDNSSPNFNAPYGRPIVNKGVPCNNKPDLLLKNVSADKSSNVPSTSVTRAPRYVEEIQTYMMNTVQQAIYTENLSQLMSLIQEYKEGDFTDEFLKTCLDAMQKSANNSAVLFRNLCQSVTVIQNKQDVKKDKSLEYVFNTIGMNLIIYSTNINEWGDAYNIYQALRDLYNESDMKNVQMFMVNKPSYIKRLLIICRIFVKKDDCRYAWELFKVNSLHTTSCWSENADQQDIQYRDLVFTELMAGLIKGKQWEIAFSIIENILKNNINELDRIVDNTIQMAAKNDCHAEYITSFMSVCPVWYNRIHCYTFRVIVVKLVRDHMYRMARTVYRQGCEMDIYPHFFGNEQYLEFSTHYVLEEVLLMLKVFLQNVVNFMPVKHAVVIKVKHSAELLDEPGTELPNLLYQKNISCEIMRVRIVNILNNYIKPPIRVVNKYSQLEITAAELEKHLEARRKWDQFC